jgi:hypothetical protein
MFEELKGIEEFFMRRFSSIIYYRKNNRKEVR